MKIYRSVGLTLAVSALLAGCGGDDSSSSGTSSAASINLIADVPVPNVTQGTNFSFDLGTVKGSKYYYTDRNNASVDVIDTAGHTFSTRIAGAGSFAFAGAKASNAVSGPNGINVVGDLLYVGDVNSVKIVDPVAATVLKNITVGTAGVRADEGCLDATHGIYMISTPEAPTPFSTFIDTATQTILAQVTFTDAAGQPSAGLEQCRYDAASDTFFVNDDGTTANPHGELVKLPGAAIRAIPRGSSVNYTSLAGVAMYSEGDCDPTGLALGAGTDIAVGCREATTGAPLLVQILNRSTGALVASVNAGGGDEMEYDAGTNRYYNAASRWTSTGNASTGGACSAASPCTPVLNVIDGTSHAVVARVPIGNNAHSVAIDTVNRQLFVPYSSSSSPAGCATCAANKFINGGVSVFTM